MEKDRREGEGEACNRSCSSENLGNDGGVREGGRRESPKGDGKGGRNLSLKGGPTSKGCGDGREDNAPGVSS